MSTEPHGIPDKFLEAADKAATSCFSGTSIRSRQGKLAIAKAINEAVTAERQRCEAICTDHISVLRKLFQNDVARAIEQVRAEIKAVSA